MNNSFDIVILGAGMVGMSTAYEALKLGKKLKIGIIEKEHEVGLHTSGRNSGVLHAGIYYKPGSLKSKVCIKGKELLTEWVKNRKLPYKKTGKIVVPQRKELDSQLDVIYERARENGANIFWLNKKELRKKCDSARTSSDRALWTPDTAQVDAKTVVRCLAEELEEKGVVFIYNAKQLEFKNDEKAIKINNEIQVKYGKFINCAGLYAHDIARNFGIGSEYMLVPFKGMYWDIKTTFKANIDTNIYPVPDLELPFLGIHYTPNILNNKRPTLGPTATFAMGRESYYGLENVEWKESMAAIALLSKQIITNQGGIRKYAKEQALLCFKKNLLREAKQLIPSINDQDIAISRKVGIRPQLFKRTTNEMVSDFLCETTKDSIHVLNAISPAFTSSFALGRLIASKIQLQN